MLHSLVTYVNLHFLWVIGRRSEGKSVGLLEPIKDHLFLHAGCNNTSKGEPEVTKGPQLTRRTPYAVVVKLCFNLCCISIDSPPDNFILF